MELNLKETTRDRDEYKEK